MSVLPASFGSSALLLEQYFYLYMVCMEGHRQSNMKFMNAFGMVVQFKLTECKDAANSNSMVVRIFKLQSAPLYCRQITVAN